MVLLRFRSRARWFAAAWLVAQLAMVAMTVGALEALPTRSTLSGHCECPGSPETATCPMHSRSAPPPHHRDCAMRQASTPSVALLSVSPCFPMAPQAVTLSPVQIHSPVYPSSAGGRDRAVRPEAPPPRG